jgi:very-short-patch-repair endonuclease
VSMEQLRELGFTRNQVEWRLANDRLLRLHRGVYAVGHTRLSDRGLLLAALLAAGPDAFLSHRTAAAVMGYQRLYRRGIEVTVPGVRSVAGRKGLTLHRTTALDEADVQVRNGLRVSAPARMLIERAGQESAKTLEGLVSHSVQKRLLRLDTPSGLATLEAALKRHPRYPGNARLKTVLAGYRRTEDCKSELERAFDRKVLRPHPTIPPPERNVVVGGWEIDRLWRKQRLAVELDGRPYHVAVREMERDRRKDVSLQRLGIRPVRFTDLRMEHDVPEIVDDVCFFLGISLR